MALLRRISGVADEMLRNRLRDILFYGVDVDRDFVP